VPRALGCRHPLSSGLGFQQGGLGGERIAVRVVRPLRDRHRVDLVNRIERPVQAHVEAVAEQVLVMRPGELGRDLVGVRHPGTRLDGLRLDDAG
jgi:hypothetical protein